MTQEEAEAVEDLVAKGTPRLDAIGKVKTAEEKPQKFTSPFEAFAYGDPKEQQSARDFIALEGKQKLQDRPPSEVEERYRLFKQDPDSYKAMYGDRGGSLDQAQAARMLKYFDGRRKEVEGDFTLDDQTKQQKLQELDDLQKPYLDAAQTGGASRTDGNAGGTGPRNGEVEVVNPNGQHGYIPRANLSKALRRGYKQAAAQ